MQPVQQTQDVPYTFEKLLNEQGYFLYTNVGNSMMPLLRQRRDVIEIQKKKGRIKKYEVALYKVENKLVLHRCIAVNERNYVFSGDHNTYKEYDITDDMIIGVMTRILRNGKEIYPSSLLYRIYSHLWVDLFPLKVIILKCKKKIRWISRITPRKLINYLNWKVVNALDILNDYRISGQNLMESSWDSSNRMRRTETKSIVYLVLKRVFKSIHISNTDSVIVIGCGNGRTLAFLISQHCACQLYGIESNEMNGKVVSNWTKRYKNIHVYIQDIYEADYNRHSILFINQSFTRCSLNKLIQLLENQLSHPVLLICVYDNVSDEYLTNRAGWKLYYQEEFSYAYGLKVAHSPIKYSIWAYNPIIIGKH